MSKIKNMNFNVDIITTKLLCEYCENHLGTYRLDYSWRNKGKKELNITDTLELCMNCLIMEIRTTIKVNENE